MTMNGAYFNNLDQKGLKTALAQIPGSKTTDYILFSLNVASGTSADINFGLTGPVLASDSAATQATTDLLVKVVAEGVSSGACKRVWLSLGGWGSDAFSNIEAILTADGSQNGDLATVLMANFSAIFNQITAIDGVESVGFDLDYEQQSGNLTALVTMTAVTLYTQFQCPLTFCPYQADGPWIAALQAVYAALGVQPVAGINLQTYAGGRYNDPSAWTTDLTNAADTGVADPASFIWPIVSCDTTALPDSTPSQTATALQGWKSAGGSLWATANLPYHGHTLTDYGKAIAGAVA
ncbi:hypothetical protein M2352_001014 [Azospirillum fermentarium]|uniref:hypothetical protein n=1 Tax=Azospirillum fermentarium TaxID=1233114 RepID=UPI0022263F2F|nr:hypothetical protein [Azospirillum fermentarium]MCW2245423.1 hypothetical protein [Azospirillum fermentarium]